MKALAVATAALALALSATPATAAPVQHYRGAEVMTCETVATQPERIDLNCGRADAILDQLRWRGRTASGLFLYPSYSGSQGYVVIRARVTMSRPVQFQMARLYTRMRVTLLGNRHGQPKHLRYVQPCEFFVGWYPARVSEPCGP